MERHELHDNPIQLLYETMRPFVLIYESRFEHFFSRLVFIFFRNVHYAYKVPRIRNTLNNGSQFIIIRYNFDLQIILKNIFKNRR